MKYLKVLLVMLFGAIGGYLLGWTLVMIDAALLLGTPNFLGSPRCEETFICKSFELLQNVVPPGTTLLGVLVALGLYWLSRNKVSSP